MSTFLISCGGTGGHLSPGIALAEGLSERGHTVRLLISSKRVDARLIEKYPRLDFVRIPGTGFSLHPVRFVRFFVTQAKGFVACRKRVREAAPNAVIGFGGFTSTGIVLAARWHGVPVALHEANRVPGRAVRLLGRFAQRVYLPSGIELAAVRPAALQHMGLPVRREIRRIPMAEARTALGFDPHYRLLVVFGGSQGATVLNEWVRKEMKFLASEGIQTCCVTGLDKGRDGVVELLTKTGAPIRAHFMMFCDRVAELLCAADLVVSRAGAGTIAELVRCETPAILVPFPHAADDHQRANATAFERQGGGVAIEQTALPNLTNEVLDTIFNDELLRKFRGNLARMERANSLATLVDDLEALAGCRGAAARMSGAVRAK